MPGGGPPGAGGGGIGIPGRGAIGMLAGGMFGGGGVFGGPRGPPGGARCIAGIDCACEGGQEQRLLLELLELLVELGRVGVGPAAASAAAGAPPSAAAL